MSAPVEIPYTAQLRATPEQLRQLADGNRPPDFGLIEDDWAAIRQAAQTWVAEQDAKAASPNNFPVGTVFDHYDCRYVALGGMKFVRYADGRLGEPHIFDTSRNHVWDLSQIKIIFRPDPEETA